MTYATAANDPRPLRPLTRDQAQAALNMEENREAMEKAELLCSQLKELAAVYLDEEQQSTVADYLSDMMNESFAVFEGDLS